MTGVRVNPTLELADDSTMELVKAEALDLLERFGCRIESERALSILADLGAKVDFPSRRVRIGPELVEKALETVPGSFSLYDSNGRASVDYGAGKVSFNPGSAALSILDPESLAARDPVSSDYVSFIALTERLPFMDAHSTALIVKDVPKEVVDRYRLYLALKYGSKPVVTGAFAVDGIEVMQRMLAAARGSEQEAAEKPRAIFDVCPAPPLLWSEIGAENLIDCARLKLPVQLVSMPLSGASAPVSMLGSVVQHAAENFSGIVMHQAVSPGAPIVFGGSPSFFDMRKGTTPLGAVETMMIESLYVQFGKFLGLPTHAYMGLSDTKLIDAQTGLESAMGVLIGVLSGVDMISGPGMLDFESCQSMEKLVIDNEICGMVKRLKAGVRGIERGEVLKQFEEVGESGQFLSSRHTLQSFREEAFIVSELIDRDPRERWTAAGRKSVFDRARERVKELTAEAPPRALLRDDEAELERIMASELRRHSIETLPA